MKSELSNLVNSTRPEPSNSESSSTMSLLSSNVQPKNCTLLSIVQNVMSEAEIFGTIRTTRSPLRFCDGIFKLFSKLFAKSLILARTKCSYFINFHIAPYLKELLLAKVKSSLFLLLVMTSR